MEGPRLITGLNSPTHAGDVVNLLQDARTDGFDFVATDLPYMSSCLNRIDVTCVESKWWSTSIIGKISSPPLYIKRNEEESVEGDAIVQALCSNGPFASIAEEHLSFMLEWASHMNIPAVILPQIPKEGFMQYFRFLSSNCLKASSNNVQLWVRVPFTEDGLQVFREMHKMCDGPSNVGSMIYLNSANPLTPEVIGKSLGLLHHFCGCNLRAISFNTNVFLTNKKGYPTLSKTIQFLFTELLKRLGRTIRVMVEGDSLHHHNDMTNIDALGQSEYLSYLQYVKHLRVKDEVTSVLDTHESKMELDYLDHLQSPLQPCFDNLEFGTYEVFERDPVKYARYQEAIECALEDKIELGQLVIENDSFPTFLHTVILVVGAGRGPLVKASLNAISNINKKNRQMQGNKEIPMIKAKIFAVEKNPSAVVFLHSLKHSIPDWSSVDIIECDMRVAHKNEKLSKIISGDEKHRADIVVSELLGSFGDNELSPECLDGVQRSGLMKELCVSIPQRYDSYLAPMTSMRLHAEAQAHSYHPSNSIEGPYGKPCGNLAAMEMSYVVRTHAVSQTHRELPCWSFSHPVRKDNIPLSKAVEGISNKRHNELNFTDTISSAVGYRSGYGLRCETIENISATGRKDVVNTSYTLHGFLGTFHCLLYQSCHKKEVTISIAPNTFSTGMYSWFPLYFPLREPLVVPHNSTVRCNIWRQCNAFSVWYEWYAEVVDNATSKVIGASNLHNPGGRSSRILL